MARAPTPPRTRLAQLRNEIVPATVGAVAGAEAGVTGAAARWKDSTDEMTANLPIVVGFVLLLAFLAIWLRSARP